MQYNFILRHNKSNLIYLLLDWRVIDHRAYLPYRGELVSRSEVEDVGVVEGHRAGGAGGGDVAEAVPHVAALARGGRGPVEGRLHVEFRLAGRGLSLDRRDHDDRFVDPREQVREFRLACASGAGGAAGEKEEERDGERAPGWEDLHVAVSDRDL